MKKKTAKMIDGAYENMVTGMGHLEMDKSESTRAKGYVESNLDELARMKVQDGIAAGIVERPIETAFKEDISIIGDDDGKVFKAANEIGLIDAIKEAGEYVRLCGGAVVVAEYEGESEENLLTEPARGSKVSGYWVYSAGRVHLESADFIGNVPRIYRVELLDGRRIEIHPSRCFVFKGTKYPDVLNGVSIRERFFGVAALKKCEKSVKDFAAIIGAVVNMAQETGTMLLSLENFNEMLSKPDSGITDVQTLMSLIKLSMNSMRAVYAGANDKVQILSHNFAGIPEIIQKSINRICADSRIPVSILFGQSATGLAQTNKGDNQAYGEMVESFRSKYLYRPACSLIRDFSQRNFGKELSEFEWGNVCPLTLEEDLEAQKKQMEIVEKAINLGIITPDEARTSLFVNGHSWTIAVEGPANFGNVEE